MADREYLEAEIHRVRSKIQEMIEWAGPQSLWERITGPDELRVEQAELAVRALRAELEVYVGSLRELAQRPTARAPTAPRAPLEPAPGAPPASAPAATRSAPEATSPRPTPPGPPSGATAAVPAPTRAGSTRTAAAPAAPGAPGASAAQSSAPPIAHDLLALAARRRDASELAGSLRRLRMTARDIESVQRARPRNTHLRRHAAATEDTFRQQQASRTARTAGWDQEAAQANLLAHALGVELELPRAVLTSAELAAGANHGTIVSREDLATAILGTTDALDHALQTARRLIASIEAEDPEVRAVPLQQIPPRQGAQPAGALPLRAFLEAWRELLKIHALMERMRCEGASRLDLLVLLARWQQAAKALRAQAGDRSPLPPLNDEGQLYDFVASLTAQRPRWEADLASLDTGA